MGDGANLAYLTETLKTGRAFVVDAIDPQLDRLDVNLGVLAQSFSKTHLENIQALGQYDVINSRHSGYYFWDDGAAPDKLRRLLSSHGVLCMTVWTEHCWLYRLHQEIARRLSQAPTNATHEKIRPVLEACGLQCIDQSVRRAGIDAKDACIAPETAQALFDLSARNLDITRLSPEQKMEIVNDAITCSRAPIFRENGVSAFGLA